MKIDFFDQNDEQHLSSVIGKFHGDVEGVDLATGGGSNNDEPVCLDVACDGAGFGSEHGRNGTGGNHEQFIDAMRLRRRSKY